MYKDIKVLQITVHFSPNIGGVETHMQDLIKALSKRGCEVFVLCYQPLSTKTKWKVYEKFNNKTKIFRIPWFSGLFYKLVPHPKLEFLYLFPGLFLAVPFILVLKRPEIIHAHGLISGAIAIFWGKIFNIPIIISTHSFYNFPKFGLYHDFAQKVFKAANHVFCLSKKSLEEIKSLGLKNNYVSRFTYWVDLDLFKRKDNAKEILKWEKRFTVLYVGRLISEKGLNVLLQSVKSWRDDIHLAIIGSGPLENEIQQNQRINPNIDFLGRIEQDNLPLYYSGADVVIVPSVHEEGFGRVIIESLSCQTPVIASNRGSIPEALNKNVGILMDVTSLEIQKVLHYLYKNQNLLIRFAKNARNFVEKNYSEKNIDKILTVYSKLRT